MASPSRGQLLWGCVAVLLLLCQSFAMYRLLPEVTALLTEGRKLRAREFTAKFSEAAPAPLRKPSRGNYSEVCPGGQEGIRRPNSMACRASVLSEIEAQCQEMALRGECCERTTLLDEKDPHHVMVLKDKRWWADKLYGIDRVVGTPAPESEKARSRVWSINTSYTRDGAKVRMLDPHGVYLVEGFLTPKEADLLAEIADAESEQWLPSQYTDEYYTQVPEYGYCCARTYTKKLLMTNGLAESARSESDHVEAVLKVIRQKTEMLTRVPSSFYELAQFSKYQPGQLLSGHWDSGDIGDRCMNLTSGMIKASCNSPQYWRLITIVTYIRGSSDGGGATTFPILGLRVKPQKGQAVVFFPMHLDGSMAEEMYHASEEASKEKMVLQQWVRMPYHPTKYQKVMGDDDVQRKLDHAMRHDAWPMDDGYLSMDAKA